MTTVSVPTPLVLAFSCPDRPGIVSAVSTALFELGATIRESQQFDDGLTGRFFSRITFSGDGDARLDDEVVRGALGPVLSGLDATWVLERAGRRKRVLILASKQDHCLGELLYRWRSGDIPMEIVGVVSNHPREVYGALNLAGVPFHFLPIGEEGKRAQEQQIAEVIEETGADLVVLARYMQILTDEFSAELSGRCINIHHSFLPGFKGAKPYHQAHERGVKLIGATAHYVTADLDEWPIIVQDVKPVTHRDTPDELVRKGRDIERSVLATAVRYHLENRVLVNGHTTVVFTD